MATRTNRLAKDPSTLIQRAEGLAAFAFALYTFNRFELSWGWFIVLLFSIDVFMIGYVFDKKVGAAIYNIGHSYVIPFVLWIAAWEFESTAVMTLSLVWLAHIGMDRAFGYGLKFNKGFTHTHLGKIGK